MLFRLGFALAAWVPICVCAHQGHKLRTFLKTEKLHKNEPASEKEEERVFRDKPHEERVLHSSLGAPHEGEGLEADVPLTMAEDQLEGNHAITSVHGIAAHLVMPATAVFLICIALGNVLALTKYTKWLPESAATLSVAVLLGLLLHRLVSHNMINVETFTFVNSTVLNLFLLPIIIFQSGWSLRRSDLVSQFEYVLVFAIFGTLISTFFIGFVSYWLGTLGWHHMTDLRSNFAFAALISAVDPVATLSTYNALRVEPLLNIMVFGESTINDAVAIVLFNVVNEGWDDLHIGAVIGRMAQLLFGSMFFGMLLAFILIFFMRISKMSGHVHADVLFVWTSAFFIFACAEATHFSGIIATLFAGMMYGKYGRLHLSEKGAEVMDSYLRISASTADNCVFILCGTSTALMQSHRGMVYGLIAVVLCLLGRALSVAPCGLAVNAIKHVQGEPNTLTWRHLFMMWHGGLRGGIALVLALEVNGEWCEHKATIVNATFMVICVLLLTLGGSTELMLNTLGIATGVTAKEDILIVPNRYYVKCFTGIDHALTYGLVGHSSKEVQEELDEE